MHTSLASKVSVFMPTIDENHCEGMIPMRDLMMTITTSMRRITASLGAVVITFTSLVTQSEYRLRRLILSVSNLTLPLMMAVRRSSNKLKCPLMGRQVTVKEAERVAETVGEDRE